MLIDRVKCLRDRVGLQHDILKVTFNLELSGLVVLYAFFDADMDCIQFRLKSLFLQNELCESVTFGKHLVLDLFLLAVKLLQVLTKLLLLEQLVGALVNPIFDCFNIDTLRLVLLLFLFDSLALLFVSLLLQSFELVHFLVDDLVCLLQLILEVEHSLLFLLDALLVR